VSSVRGRKKCSRLGAIPYELAIPVAGCHLSAATSGKPLPRTRPHGTCLAPRQGMKSALVRRERACGSASTPLEIWGGIECTRNRVGEAFFDQLELGGHVDRLSDLRLVAELGVKTLRYPVLWERVAPLGIQRADWGWVDERLGMLRELCIRPIVGFVHHGSGPSDTSLLDPRFPERLAEFSAAFADRFPWIEWFTPVNEPLTTARFSGLYGHWYPHHQHDQSFVQSLLIQCQAVAASMRAVRTVRPDARLLQTEDAGRIFGSRSLVSQVRFENHRRWLTFDLLSGRVNSSHPLWLYLTQHGASRPVLEALADAPCPADMLGLNFYVTSDRSLDADWQRYPDVFHGGNGRQRYVDTEAVRLRVRSAASHQRVLSDAWQRYRVPLTLSEVHLGGHREDQLRWLQQAWRAAHRARQRGVDVRAMTVWSLFGAFGWDTLVTGSASYESGAFDVRGDGRRTPRPTAVAAATRDLVADRAVEHPVARGKGWWNRSSAKRQRPPSRRERPILLVGSAGTLGSAFRRICAERALATVALTRADVDVTDPEALGELMGQLRPWIVINAAGFCDVDAAEFDERRCLHANVAVPLALARACARHAVPLVTFSSDLVFDGRSRTPYVECALLGPLNAYGIAKAQAEQGVRALTDNCLIVRTSAFFGPWDPYNFAARVIAHGREGRQIVMPSDVVVSATYVPDLVNAVLDLAIDGASGTWHLVSSEGLTWHELATLIATSAKVDTATVVAAPASRMEWAAIRPAFSALTSARANLLPTFDSCLQRFIADSAGNEPVSRITSQTAGGCS
jgi:dTDP-4-dehydrorhamnose reductase